MQDKAEAPWRGAKTINDLEPVSAKSALAAARSFRLATSIGCDDFPPRLVATLSEQLREAIAAFLNEVERHGIWPVEVATAIILLIPKTD